MTGYNGQRACGGEGSRKVSHVARDDMDHDDFGVARRFNGASMRGNPVGVVNR